MPFDPVQHQPGTGRHAQHGQRVGFGFHRVEPERIGEGQQKPAGQCAATDGQAFVEGQSVPVPVECNRLHDDQVNGRHRERAEEARREIHQPGDAHAQVGQYGEEPADQDVERGSRRMGNAQDIGCRDEFAAVPEGHRGRDGPGIHGQRHDERHRHAGHGNNAIGNHVLEILSHSSVTGRNHRPNASRSASRSGRPALRIFRCADSRS